MPTPTIDPNPNALTPSASARPAGPRLRIGFLTRDDARDRRSWSGIFHYMVAALEAHCGEVIHLGPATSRRTQLLGRTTQHANQVWRRLTWNTLILDHNRVLSKQYGRIFAERIERTQCDVLFAPVASVEVAHLKTGVPIVYFGDTTWRLITNYYSEYSFISRLAKAEGDRIEAAAIAKASAAVYPSRWALDSACDHYNLPRDSAFLIPMGANLDHPPTREQALDRGLCSPVNLLLVGVSWNRKGGEIAFRCLTSLLERGIDARLTICGCVPPEPFQHPRLRVIPRLDKRDPEQRRQLSRLYEEAHFFVLPTRAEALGVVICEASAHGLPTLVSDTGGVRGALTHGVNGFLLPFEAGGEAYADQILELIADPVRYHALCVSTRDEFERTLNWDAWGRQMSNVFHHVLAGKLIEA